MKQFLGFVVMLFLGLSNGNAQAPKGMGKSDPDAKKILDAVSAKFKSYKTVQQKFWLKIENAAGKIIGTKSGAVLMKGRS